MSLFRVTDWECVGINEYGAPTLWRPATLWQRFVFALQRKPRWLTSPASSEWPRTPDVNEPGSLAEAKARVHSLLNVP